MEPRSAERGNFWADFGAKIGLESFNGATLSRTWKPRLRGFFARGSLASMEPRSAERGNGYFDACPASKFRALQWSHAQPNVETQKPGSLLRLQSRASMEPRSAERGNKALTRTRRLRLPSFNGATLSRTWKPSRRRRFRNACSSFNGATLSRTWKPRPAHQSSSEPRASMEPRSAERGNNGQFWNTLPIIPALQWSHAQPNVETLLLVSDQVQYNLGFNGATLSRTWKHPSKRRFAPSLGRLQWSHAQPNVETKSNKEIADLVGSFNGATLSRTWKR